VIVSLILVGIFGLRLIEHASWVNCFYMTIITLSTVGYEDPIHLSTAGKIFISLYLMGSLGVFTCSLFQIGQWIVGSELRRLRERRRMNAAINRLENHYIVCGQGRMGLEICRYLAQREKPFVVIDLDETKLTQIASPAGWLHIHGDATDDQVLRDAGIERARSLATVLPSDAANLYVVLSARMLAKGLQIIARASEEKAVDKLLHAGATRIVSPFSSGAVKMARFMLNPSIEDFLEIADQQGNELELADFQISAQSPYVGKKRLETGLREQGVMVIGIRRPNGERLMPPPADAVLQSGDCLFAFGSARSINAVLGVDRLH
jgi:voltage-gated potassium channel